MNRKILPMLVAVSLVMCCFGGIGCTYRAGDFTLASTKNLYAHGVDLTKLPQKQGVEAEGDAKFFGFGLNYKDPTDRALEKGGGNLMIDAVYYVESYWFFAKAKVRGTVVNVPYEAGPGFTAPGGATTQPTTSMSSAASP
jgi:hypothetical protein